MLDSFEHPARPIRTVRMERNRVLWKMVGSARRPDGCRRRADVPAERKAMRRSALHAALRRSSFGHEEAVAGRAGGPWELVRRDERRPGRLGRLIGQLPQPPPPPQKFLSSEKCAVGLPLDSVGPFRIVFTQIWVVKVTASR